MTYVRPERCMGTRTHPTSQHADKLRHCILTVHAWSATYVPMFCTCSLCMQTSPFLESAFPAQIPGLCAPMWALGPFSGHDFGASFTSFFFVFSEGLQCGCLLGMDCWGPLPGDSCSWLVCLECPSKSGKGFDTSPSAWHQTYADLKFLLLLFADRCAA